MARRAGHAATRLREQVETIRMMAIAQSSLALVGGVPKNARHWEWMRHPHPGDLVVEQSTAIRAGGPDAVGRLVRVFDGDDGVCYEIALIHRRGTTTWSNASFIRPVVTQAQYLALNSIDDGATFRAWHAPLCPAQRDVSYEHLGCTDDWIHRYRCRGCGAIAERRRWSGEDVPLCETCHVPEPIAAPCEYCARSCGW